MNISLMYLISILLYFYFSIHAHQFISTCSSSSLQTQEKQDSVVPSRPCTLSRPSSLPSQAPSNLHFIIFPFISPPYASWSLISQAFRNLQL